MSSNRPLVAREPKGKSKELWALLLSIKNDPPNFNYFIN